MLYTFIAYLTTDLDMAVKISEVLNTKSQKFSQITYTITNRYGHGLIIINHYFHSTEKD
jgi:hypothetical protein